MDFQIEEEFLGALMLNPDLMKKIIIPEECIMDAANNFIFKLFKKQYSEHKTISLVGLAEHYKHLFNEKFNLQDIIPKLSRILAETSPIVNFDYYQESLFARYKRYKILDLINKYKNEKISTDDLLNSIHKYESLSITSTQGKLDAKEIYSMINSKNKNIEFRLKKLSDTANIQEHDLVVIAARPGIGKSGFMLNLIEDLSNQYPCLLFNLEMSEKQVYQRLVAINTQIPMIYHDKPATEHQKTKIIEGCRNVANKQIKVISAGQTIESIRRKIINESKEQHLLVFIDYVGLIGSSAKHPSLYEKITSIVKELRQISLDFNCTIFLASQINRSSEKEKDKMPKISDLKESGELEQSATTVLLIHDEYHNKNLSKKDIEISVIIGKNRNGKLGLAKMKYYKETQRFEEIQNIVEKITNDKKQGSQSQINFSNEKEGK